MAGNRVPGQSDFSIWAEAMRNVTPLRRRAAPARLMPPNEPPIMVENASMPTALPPVERFAGIDRATAERLKRGRHPIEGRLDLHGRTQAEAHRDLIDFVEASYQSGRRCVLVITGRGLGPDGPGVLKCAVPRWLAEASVRRRVLAVASAQPRHGGAGALYLLLRRQRDGKSIVHE
jgi:DNA-nicking Smr family endonuclease